MIFRYKICLFINIKNENKVIMIFCWLVCILWAAAAATYDPLTSLPFLPAKNDYRAVRDPAAPRRPRTPVRISARSVCIC